MNHRIWMPALLAAVLALPAAAVTYQSQWGVTGSAAGEFAGPNEMATNSAGKIYVVDRDNSRIQKFDSDGTYLRQWGSAGTGDGEFNGPSAVAVDPTTGQVYVGENGGSGGTNRIQRFGANGQFQASWSGFGRISSLAVNNFSKVFVAISNAHSVRKYDSDGVEEQNWGGGVDNPFHQPTALAKDPTGGRIYVGDSGSIFRFSVQGVQQAEWNVGYPVAAVAVDSSGHVYATDRNSHHVQKFDGDGNLLTEFGGPGSAAGQMNGPAGIAVGPDGSIYVADTANDRVQRFTNADVVLTVPQGPQQTLERQLLTFDVSAVDGNGDAVVVTMNNGAPGNVSFDGTSFSWKPLYSQQGQYTITFSATAGGVTVAETVDITVVDVNRPPTLSGPAAVSEAEGTLVTFAMNGGDPDGQAVTIAAQGLPTGATFDGTQFVWQTSFEDAGVYPVQFTVSDGDLSTQSTVSVTITDVNRAPELSVPGPRSRAEGGGLNFLVSASDPDGGPVTIAAQGLPAGATFEDDRFIWQTNFDDAGQYSVQFTASDGQLNTTATVSITVENVNRLPVLQVPGDQSVAEGAELSFVVAASDADGQDVTITKTGPGSFDGTTFSWTPGYQKAGSHTVTFTGSDGEGSATADVKVVVSDVNRAPFFQQFSATWHPHEGVPGQLLVRAIDPDYRAVTISSDDLPDGATLELIGHNATSVGTLTSYYLKWTPAFTDAGVHLVNLKASDGVLDVTRQLTSQVQDRPQPLTVSLADGADLMISENQPGSFDVVATDADLQPMAATAQSLPAGATFDGTTFRWTPGFDDAGNHTVMFAAVQSGRPTVTESVALTVENVDRPATLTIPGAQFVDEGTELTFAVSAHDPDEPGGIGTVTAGDLPEAAVFDGDVFSWTPDASQGADPDSLYRVGFHTSDGSNDTVDVFVQQVLLPPQMAVQGRQTVDAGELLTLSVTAQPEPGQTLATDVADLPTGATLVDHTLRWIPTIDQVGSHVIVVTGRYGGLTSTLEVTVTVREPAVDEIAIGTNPLIRSYWSSQYWYSYWKSYIRYYKSERYVSSYKSYSSGHRHSSYYTSPYHYHTYSTPIYSYRNVPVYGGYYVPVYRYVTAYYVNNGGYLDIRVGATEQQSLRSPSYRYPLAQGAESRPVLGDVDGDGADEFVIGGGPGRGGRIDILDSDRTLLKTIVIPWSEYNSSNGETWPAAGDVDGDGEDEIVVGLGEGGQGLVYIFDDASHGYELLHTINLAHLASYSVPTGERFEVRPSVGDIDGDGEAEIALNTGPQAARYVWVFDGASDAFAFHSYTYSAYGDDSWTALHDLDGDGRSELISTRPDTYGRIYRLAASGGNHWFYSGHAPPCRSRPAVGDIDGNGKPQVLCAGTADSGSEVGVWNLRESSWGSSSYFTYSFDRWITTQLDNPMPSVGNINP